MRKQIARNEIFAVTTSSQQLSAAVTGSFERSAITVQNLDAVDSVTIAKITEGAAVANTGIVLGPGATFSESTDSAYLCWQGAYQIIGSGAANCAISETFQERE